MNCQDFQNELLLNFGEEMHSKESLEHLEICTECQRFRDELRSIESDVSSDRLFKLDEIDGDSFVSAVENKINQREKKETKTTYLRPMLTAAAVLFLVFIAVVVINNNSNYNQANISDSGSVINEIGITVAEDEINDLLDDEILSMMSGMEILSGEDAEQFLMDDLSEEEWEYLESEFDIKEILL